MATDIWRGVRGDLRRILLALPGVPDVAFEGRAFTPTTGVSFISERIEKGGARTVTLGGHGQQEERAIYALDLNIPRVSSFADGEDLADAIRCAFRPGREIASVLSDYAMGRVIASSVRTPIMFADWTQFPIRIEFFIRRATAQGWA